MRNLTVFPNVSLFRPGHPDDVAERFAGYFVAFAVGLVAFTWMAVTVYELPTQIRPHRELRIVLEAEPPPPPPPEPPPPELPKVEDMGVPEIAATSVNPSEEAPMRDAIDGEEMAMLVKDESVEPPAPPSLSDWRPTSPDEERKVREIEEMVKDYRDRLEQRETDVQAQINRFSIESAGRKFLLNSDGGQNGIIRTFDIADFPQHIVLPLLKKYGIQIEYKHVNPAQGQRGYLNAATTSEGTFTSVAREGFYEVFVLTPKAVAMLSAKEVDALFDRGFDPRTSRIRKITFGIIKNKENEYDIGVTEFEAERTR